METIKTNVDLSPIELSHAENFQRLLGIDPDRAIEEVYEPYGVTDAKSGLLTFSDGSTYDEETGEITEGNQPA